MSAVRELPPRKNNADGKTQRKRICVDNKYKFVFIPTLAREFFFSVATSFFFYTFLKNFGLLAYTHSSTRCGSFGDRINSVDRVARSHAHMTRLSRASWPTTMVALCITIPLHCISYIGFLISAYTCFLSRYVCVSCCATPELFSNNGKKIAGSCFFFLLRGGRRDTRRCC